MARGRMLNKKISLNPEIAEIANSLGCEAALVITWMISHLDRDGRITANPIVLKAQVAPMLSGVTPDLIRSVLAKASELGVVSLYSVDGKDFLEFVKFKENQSGMRYEREAESEIPANSGLAPDLVRTNSDNCRLNRIEENRSKEKRKEENIKEKNTAASAALILSVFDHYRTYHPRAHPKPNSNSKEWRAIAARLKEGYTAAGLKQAIDGCHKSPFHQGENDRGKKYDTLELIMRDSSKVNNFIETAEAPEQPVMSENERRSKRAGQNFLKRLEVFEQQQRGDE